MRNRKLIVAIAIFAILFGLLVARSAYLAMSSDLDSRISSTSIKITSSGRGKILDRKGRVLARDLPAFDVLVDERYADKIAGLAVAEGLKNMTEEQRLEFLNRLALIAAKVDLKKPRKERVLSRVSYEVAMEVYALLPSRIVLEPTASRVYDYAESCGHITGYVGQMTKSECQDIVAGLNIDETLGNDFRKIISMQSEHYNELTGRAGVEKSMNHQLAPTFGISVVSYFGAKREETSLIPSKPGADVSLTIDADLQKKVHDIILTHGGRISVAACRVDSGEILLLDSVPSYDPNVFVPPQNTRKVREYLGGEDAPMLARCVSSAYPPGSIYKIVTAYAALELGMVKPDEAIDCKGYYGKNHNQLRCWINVKSGGSHGPVTLKNALEVSCNCYFYELGSRLGTANIILTGKKFGAHERTGIELPAESSGIMRGRALGDAVSSAIGQGCITMTPIQALQMVATVAADGFAPRLHLVAGNSCEPKKTLDTAIIARIKEGMVLVVNGSSGTARDSGVSQFRVAGKTGTAQVGGNKQPHSWFVCYWPYDAPKFAMVVMVENGGSGGSVAASLASRIIPLLNSHCE